MLWGTRRPAALALPAPTLYEESPGETTMHDLYEIDAIQRLKHRYLRCLDQKLWDELETCFTEDATCAYGDGKYSFQGRAAIIDFLRTAMGAPSFLSSHRVHHPEIELTSATTATGIWALDDVVIDFGDGSARIAITLICLAADTVGDPKARTS